MTPWRRLRGGKAADSALFEDYLKNFAACAFEIFMRIRAKRPQRLENAMLSGKAMLNDIIKLKIANMKQKPILQFGIKSILQIGVPGHAMLASQFSKPMLASAKKRNYTE
jgi:hypothetical protein